MATIRAYTTIEQSRKLAEILPIESADMHYVMVDTYEDKYAAGLGKYIGILPHYTCWSLAALLSVLPYGYSSILTKSFNGKDYYCKIDGKPFETLSDNPIDACYELILKLKELNLL